MCVQTSVTNRKNIQVMIEHFMKYAYLLSFQESDEVDTTPVSVHYCKCESTVQLADSELSMVSRLEAGLSS